MKTYKTLVPEDISTHIHDYYVFVMMINRFVWGSLLMIQSGYLTWCFIIRTGVSLHMLREELSSAVWFVEFLLLGNCYQVQSGL